VVDGSLGRVHIFDDATVRIIDGIPGDV